MGEVSKEDENANIPEKALNERQLAELVEKNIWLVRPCYIYQREESECKSLKSRFHQYFIHGSLYDCNPWSRDVNVCGKCLDENNIEACAEIIAHEQHRRLQRLISHNKNDVWQKRDQPPENWNSELPASWYESNKKSILIQEAKNFEQYILENRPHIPQSCTIL